MKRIPISFTIDSSQHWLFYYYVESVAPISTANDKKLQTVGGSCVGVPATLRNSKEGGEEVVGSQTLHLETVNIGTVESGQ